MPLKVGNHRSASEIAFPSRADNAPPLNAGLVAL